MTVYARITTALVELLRAPTPVAELIYRAQVKPINSSANTAVVVYPAESVIDRLAMRGAPMNLDSVYFVECYARSTTDDADLAIDALLGVVYQRIADNPTLDGSVMDVIISSIRFDFGLEIDRLGVAILTLSIKHRADGHTLE